MFKSTQHYTENLCFKSNMSSICIYMALYLIHASMISSQKIVTLLHLVALFSFTFDNRNASKEAEETAEPSRRSQPQEDAPRYKRSQASGDRQSHGKAQTGASQRSSRTSRSAQSRREKTDGHRDARKSASTRSA